LIRASALGNALALDESMRRNWYPGHLSDVSGLVTVFKIYYYYLKTLVYPVNLCFECKLVASASWQDSQVFVSVLAILLVLAAAFYAWRRLPCFAVGTLWFFISLLPMAQIFPLADLAMEHFLYLPSIGFCLALAKILENSADAFPKSSAQAKAILPVLLCLILFFYSALTWERNFVYKNENTLWTDVTNKAPQRKHGEKRLGKKFYSEGNKQDALRHFRRAIIADPGDPEAHYYAGVVLEELGQLDSALDEYRQVVRLDPGNPVAHDALGYLLGQKGDWEGAVKEFQAALKLKPDFFSALNNLGLAYVRLGRCDEAGRILGQIGDKAPASFAQLFREKCPP